MVKAAFAAQLEPDGIAVDISDHELGTPDAVVRGSASVRIDPVGGAAPESAALGEERTHVPRQCVEAALDGHWPEERLCVGAKLQLEPKQVGSPVMVLLQMLPQMKVKFLMWNLKK